MEQMLRFERFYTDTSYHWMFHDWSRMSLQNLGLIAKVISSAYTCLLIWWSIYSKTIRYIYAMSSIMITLWLGSCWCCMSSNVWVAGHSNFHDEAMWHHVNPSFSRCYYRNAQHWWEALFFLLPWSYELFQPTFTQGIVYSFAKYIRLSRIMVSFSFERLLCWLSFDYTFLSRTLSLYNIPNG